MKFVHKFALAGALAGLMPLAAPSLVLAQNPQAAQNPVAVSDQIDAPPAAARITEDQLGQMIAALGLKPEKKLQRFDFAFQSELDGAAWEFSMSAVLSQDGASLWIMAWLDPLPTASADVPRTALLRLLAQNDQLGQGKFFAYVPNNRRFVLQRVVPNENLSSARLAKLLMDLGSSVAESRPVWSVANWNTTGVPNAPVGAAAPAAVAPGAVPPAVQPVESALNDSKFEEPVRR